MKYLKQFESLNFSDNVKKILSDFGISESEYEQMIDVIGKQEYTEVRDSLPFFTKAFTTNDYDIGYDNMRKLINYYNSVKKRLDLIDTVEDYFIDMTDDGKISIIKDDKNHISFKISSQKLDVIGNTILEISNRLKRSNISYIATNINTSVGNTFVNIFFP